MNIRYGALIFCATMMVLSGAHATQLSAYDFFSKRKVSTVLVSPTAGKKIYVREEKDDFSIHLGHVDSSNFEEVFAYKKLFGKKGAYLSMIDWIDDRYIALAVVEEMTPVAELTDTRYKARIYFLDSHNIPTDKKNLIGVKTEGQLVNVLPAQPGKFLYAKSGVNSRVYEIDVSKLNVIGKRLSKSERVDGGQFTHNHVVAKVSGYVGRWFMHGEKVVGALSANPDGQLNLLESTNDGKSWKVVKVLREKEPTDRKRNKKHARSKKKIAEKPAIPLDYAGQSGSYYSVIEREGEPPALYKVDYISGDETLIYQSSAANIHRITTSYEDKGLRSIVMLSRGEPDYLYFDDKHSKVVASLRKQGIKGYLALVDNDLNGNHFIAYNFASDNPGRFVYFDASKDKKRIIKSVLPELDDRLHSRLISGQVQNDGLEIEYFLTLPTSGKNSSPRPLILIPHGGPIGVMDNRLYHPVTQYFVSRGFGVLQVNYRGSAGYGKAFIEAGKKQWGTGMLSDIKIVLDTVLRRPDIDSDKVCVVGGSYGGYAALALPLKYKGSFRCAAAFAAVTDVQLYASRLSGSKSTLQWLRENVGDPQTEADYMQAISPVYSARDYEIPLLIAHGNKDKVVDVEHYYRMQYALKRANIAFTGMILEDIGHGFESPDDSASFYKQVADFVEKSTAR